MFYGSLGEPNSPVRHLTADKRGGWVNVHSSYGIESQKSSQVMKKGGATDCTQVITYHTMNVLHLMDPCLCD